MGKLHKSLRCVNRVYHGRLRLLTGSIMLQEEAEHFTRLNIKRGRSLMYHMRKRVYPERGTVMVFPRSMKFRAMGSRMNRLWLLRHLMDGGCIQEIHLQTATWVAQMFKPGEINIWKDSTFAAYKTLCEPELFPSSRLITLPEGGGKINLFASGKAICMGKRFTKRHSVYNILRGVRKYINTQIYFTPL